MSLRDLVRSVEQRSLPEAPAAAVRALAAGWAWTRSRRQAVAARALYAAVRAAMPAAPLREVYAATRAAVAQLGGWFVVRGNLRHVRGCRLNHMTDVEAEQASRHLRKPWRPRKDGNR